jgi:exopolysaccharide biosynthesis polyprenyl glycosylphosphotransferase
MLRRFSINFALLSMSVDGIVIAFCLWLATLLRPSLNSLKFIEPISTKIVLPLTLFFFSPIIWVGILSAFSIYDGKKYLRVVDEFAVLSTASVIAAGALAGILYFSYRDISRALFILFVTLSVISLFLWRTFARFYFRARQVRDQTGTRRILIVGAGSLGQKIREQMLQTEVESLDVIGFLDDEFAIGDDVGVIGGLDDIARLIREYAVSDVVIALPHSAYRNLAHIVGLLYDIPVRVWVALGFFDLALYKTDISDVAGIPMLDLRAPALSDYQMLVKRAFDLILSSIAIILVSPLMLISSLLVWLEDRGPVIFKQERIGENGRSFIMYKFRTMVINAQNLRLQVEKMDENGNLLHKFKGDPRVTGVGRILRRLSLDELPQLINVLKGDMSLVGPRPELPYLVEKYQPWQRKRFAVPPGITGWWQINGRSDRPMHLNTEDDMYYISNYSIWLDIKILISTAWVILIGKGSY